MQTINWNARRQVFVSVEHTEAYVRSCGGFVEFDDYRENGGRVENSLPEDAVLLGVFTHAEIANMPYPI